MTRQTVDHGAQLLCWASTAPRMRIVAPPNAISMSVSGGCVATRRAGAIIGMSPADLRTIRRQSRNQRPRKQRRFYERAFGLAAVQSSFEAFKPRTLSAEQEAEATISPERLTAATTCRFSRIATER